MRAHFPLFRSHLDLAHRYWQQLLQMEEPSEGFSVIDATAGNGHDALMLAKHVLPQRGRLLFIDLQQAAIDATWQRLSGHFLPEDLLRVQGIQGSHRSFPKEIEAESIQLIVYNLGYLPSGDKELTTKTDSTLESIQAALSLIRSGGAISITCYPGHPEGDLETQALASYVQGLDPTEWSATSHQWLNRQKSPRLLLLQKRL
ncbi:MAG: putative rRNA methylase [Chlamydiales bacterium]|jgi:hypothetical protein|nr:putative rRNA methylase [Chlamydiales bacterium]